MKKKLLFILICLVIVVQDIFGQQWMATLTMNKYPSAVLYTWENNPNIATLTVTNTTLDPKEVLIYITVTKSNQSMLDARSKSIAFSAGETQVFSSLDFLDWNSLKYNSSVKNTIIQTGLLPEGDYTVCLEVWSIKQGNQLIEKDIKLTEACDFCRIQIVDPPVLLTPTQQSNLDTKLPLFQWAPCNVLPPLTVDYKFTLVEILPGQTPVKAIQANQPILETTVAGVSLLQYPFEALTLEEGKQYAWQVQAVSGASSPEQVQFKTDGKSEVRSFKILKEEKAIELTSPSDNSILATTPLSQNAKAYKFTWATHNIKKTITYFVLKICEILPGQSSESAISNNLPVFYKEDILPSMPMYWITEEEGSLIDQKKYAWRVWAYSQPWGGVIDSSNVWSFTAIGGYERIKLISPINHSELEADTLHCPSKCRTYQFKWDKSELKKTVTNFYLKIAELNDGQSPSQALKVNPAVYYNNKINPVYSSFTLPEETGGLKDQQKYAWQVTAYSTSYNGLTAVSQAESFVVKNGVTLADNITSFTIGGYDIKVLSVANKNANYFSGTGEVTLWSGAPKIQFDFTGLKIISEVSSGNVLKWKVVAGEIWTKIQQLNLPLTLNVPGSASLKVNAIRFRIDSTTILGYVKFNSSLLVKNANQSANLILESDERWFNVDQVNKITGGASHINKNYEFSLLTPLNFNLNISRTKSQLKVEKSKLTLNITGELLLPQNVKKMDGDRIALRFWDKPDFKFPLNVSGNDIIIMRLVNNSDIQCKINETNIDLYSGSVAITGGEISFDYSKMNYSPVQIDNNDNFKITSTGINGFVRKLNLNLPGIYRGYTFYITQLSLNYEQGIMKNSLFSKISNFLRGKISIPFIKKQADIHYSLSSNGLNNGTVSPDGISGWTVISGGQQGDKSSLKMQIVNMSYMSHLNSFYLNGYFKFDCTGTDGLTTENLPVSNVRIDSTGAVFILGSDQDGWVNLSVSKPGKFNGFPIMLDRFRLKTYANYAFGIAGTIVVAEDLSAQNGSPFDASIVVMKNSGGKSGTEVPSSEVEVKPIGVDFGNGETSFGAQLTVFNNDPVYGKGFLASFNMTMHDPTEFSVFSKIIVGKTDNGAGFSYWFVEAGAIFPVAITAVSDIGIRGFTGRVYSHMKHQGDGILGSDYVPDKNNSFGVYAMLPITSVSDDGSKFWGKVALEIRVGNGFQSTLYGEIYVLSSGFLKEDAKIKGTATIYISTNPKVFDSQFTVDANLWDGLCGSGEMQLHISESEWYLHVGTKEQPISLRMFCSAGGFNGYFTIDQNYLTAAAGYSFNTGPQKWGAGLGCYGKASGNIYTSNTIYYKPLQFVSTAYMSAYGEIGVYVDIKVYTGYLSLLSGEMSAHMQVTFPDPVCFAGKVYAKACIKVCAVSCKICRSATFRIRYKDGSFALKDQC